MSPSPLRSPSVSNTVDFGYYLLVYESISTLVQFVRSSNSQGSSVCFAASVICSVLGWERARVPSAERVWEWISELAHPFGGMHLFSSTSTYVDT